MVRRCLYGLGRGNTGWKRPYNVGKRGVMHFTRTKNLSPVNYHTLTITVKIKKCQYVKKLGIYVSDDLKWSCRILHVAMHRVVAKVNRILGF